MSHPLVRPVISVAAALTTILALTLGTASQAQAAQPWLPAACATGQFTGIETSVDDKQTALRGYVTPCAPSLGDPKFALVVFSPSPFSIAFAYSHLVVSYEPNRPTMFAGVFRSKPQGEQMGVCAMRTLSDRIACVRVTFPDDGSATMEPIRTTDPLVMKSVFYVEGEIPPPDPHGFCGSCLELPTS
ncbi:hypothetical protein [Micromonospora sp. CPCC 206061]|uniref:hypothetical protein n=1 Tax=Micromonospora sp. CPCC 206061 TaxID=3122410 RepID=UPI002FF2270F